MQRSFFLLPSALLFVACAPHEEDMRMAAAPPPFEATQQAAPLQYEAPPVAPPRLNHVVTLGQQEDYAPFPIAPAQQQGNGVVVNNNITVNAGSPGYGYGGYYGGYGYSSRGGSGHRSTSADGRGNTTSTGQQPRGAWAPSGWEGAQRTAAPGQTPNVGGNYSAPPSYGPAQMK